MLLRPLLSIWNLMTNPLSLSCATGGLVIRMGGNVLTPRGSVAADRDALDGILHFVKSSAALGLDITLLPGGVGGNIFLEWGRQVECSDAIMNGVGCSLIDLGATIIADYFHRALDADGIPACAKPARGIDEIRTLHSAFRVVVSASGIAGAITSDSLSLLIGEALGHPILSIKRSLPFAQLAEQCSDISETHTCHIEVSDLARVSNEYDVIEQAGWHPALDTWSIRLLHRSSIDLFITTIDAILAYSDEGRLTPVMKISS